MKPKNGFTIIEILIAIIVLVVGTLGLVTTAAMVSRMLGRGSRSAAMAAFDTRRIERLRTRACISAQRTSGADTLYRGAGNWVAITNWTWTDMGNSYYRLRMITGSKTQQYRTRTDTLETGVICRT